MERGLFALENNCYPFVNLPLPYEFDAMEPFIDAKTMQLHHDRHLQTYIDRLNEALKEHRHLQRLPLEQLVRIAGRLPFGIRQEIRNNAGGVYNHRLYFDLLRNPAEEEPKGRLADAIARCFGSFARFRQLFTQASLGVFGSGYAWLVRDGARLRIVTTPDQDSPLSAGLVPILTVDVWEHAYYLKHYNLRADYLSDWFRIINWDYAGQMFLRHMRE